MPDHPFIKKNAGVEVIAHRGGWRLWPENTLYAFQHAIDLGVDMLEMDIRSTKDGHIVVFHDETVTRTTNGNARVNDLTLAELKQLDAGYKWTADRGATFPFRGKGIVSPTLDEVFASFPHMRMTIEIKQKEPDIVEAFGNLIRHHGMQHRVLVACFDSGTLKRFRKLFPEVATSPGHDRRHDLLRPVLAAFERGLSAQCRSLAIPAKNGADKWQPSTPVIRRT